MTGYWRPGDGKDHHSLVESDLTSLA